MITKHDYKSSKKMRRMKELYFKRFSAMTAENNTPSQQVANYLTSYVNICGVVKNVMMKSASDYTLYHKPDDWYDFIEELTTAQSKVDIWTNKVLKHLKSLPGKLSGDANLLVTHDFDKMLSKCIFLIDDPNHSSTLQHLKLDIQAAYNTIDDMLQDTQDIINQMDNFSNNITPLANELENLSNRAYNDRQIDSEKVMNLRNDVSMIKADIANCGVMLIASLLVEGGIILIGGGITIATFIATGPLGGISIGFFTATLAVLDFIAITLCGANLISEINKLSEKTKSLNQYEQDALQLGIAADDFDTLSKQADGMKNDLKVMMNMWNNIKADLQDEEKRIEQGEKEMKNKEFFTSNDWKETSEKLEQVSQWFKRFSEEILKLNVDALFGAETQLSVGMSSDEVKAAVDKAPKKELIAYLTA
jgi:predicted  nucleic acid-binding Zn-ribbon protein